MRKIALLVGVSNCESGFEQLPAAVRDIEAMKQVLANPDMGGFAEADVKVLPNPARQEMADAIYNLFSNRHKDDLLLFYFSGHGVVDEHNEFYFTTSLTRKEQDKLVPTTALEASAVRSWMESSKSQQQVVILDSCYSGAFARGLSAKNNNSINIEQYLGGKGRAILTASTSTQYALMQEGLDLSIYTHFLIEGIRTGSADQDGDGKISVKELHAYIFKKVKGTAPAMTPEFYPVREGDTIILAKSPTNDPRLRYRRQVEIIAEEDGENFSIANRMFLEDVRNGEKLSKEDVSIIEDEVLTPYRIGRENLERYRQAFTKIVRQQRLVRQRKGLNRLKNRLSLRDEDAKAIEREVWISYYRNPAIFTCLVLLLCDFGLNIIVNKTPGFFPFWSFTNPVPPIPPNQFQGLVSDGQIILSTSEGRNAKNPDAFNNEKRIGTEAIASGRYGEAIKALESTRNNPANPQFYKNAPETLIYLNNAYIGDKKAYTIAVAAPISQLDNYGLGILRGVALAQREINGEKGNGGIEGKNGKIPLRILLLDDLNTPNIEMPKLLAEPSFSVPNLNKDIKILGVIGHENSDITVPLEATYTQEKLPVISPSATSSVLYSKPNSYVHPVAPSTKQMAEELVSKIKTTVNGKVTVFFDSHEEYSNSFGAEVCNELQQNICVPWDFYKNPQLDVSGIRDKIIKEQSKAIVIAFNPNLLGDKERTVKIIEAVSELNKVTENVKLFGGTALYDQSLRNHLKNVSMVIVSPWNPVLGGGLSPGVYKNNEIFKNLNINLWNTDQVNWYTLMAYNATKAFIEAIKELRINPPDNFEELREDRIAINDKFRDLSVPGALGNFHFSKDGYVDRGTPICLSHIGFNTRPNASDECIMKH